MTFVDTGRNSRDATSSSDGGVPSSSVTSSLSGSSQEPHVSGVRSSGIRSWMSASCPIASVVSTAALTTGGPSLAAGSRHTVHSPAMAMLWPSGLVMKNGCLTLPSRFHSYQPSAGTRQRRLATEVRNAEVVAAVSDRALIMRAPMDMSFAHAGIRPQRMTRRLRTVVAGSGSPSSSRGCRCTTATTFLVGATL